MDEKQEGNEEVSEKQAIIDGVRKSQIEKVRPTHSVSYRKSLDQCRTTSPPRHTFAFAD
jgi:hypothetical protein